MSLPIAYYEIWVESPTVPMVQHKSVFIVANTLELNQDPYPAYLGPLINPLHVQWDDPANPGKKVHAVFPLNELYYGYNYTAKVRAVDAGSVASAWSTPSPIFAKDPAYVAMPPVEQPPVPPGAPPTPTGLELFP